MDDEFGCKICGKLSKNQTEHNKHLHESHSMSAINLSKEVIHKNSKSNMNLKGCTECERSFFFSDTLGLHMNKYHKDAYLKNKAACVSAASITNIVGDVLEKVSLEIVKKEEIKTSLDVSSDEKDTKYEFNKEDSVNTSKIIG